FFCLPLCLCVSASSFRNARQAAKGVKGAKERTVFLLASVSLRQILKTGFGQKETTEGIGGLA
ncbi:MAG: hypothetical protein KDD89_07130, partial [Anaerolineales bacterium]|nr:hypothetical protein [Anaerolineales bacterium]